MDNASKIIKNLTTIVATVIGLAIVIAIVVAVIKAQTEPSDDGSMSMSEAQTKCMLMEEADLVNLNGEPFGDATTKKAQDYCLSLWDSPEKEDSFRKAIEADWDSRKNEVLEGYTLDQYYNEYAEEYIK